MVKLILFATLVLVAMALFLCEPIETENVDVFTATFLLTKGGALLAGFGAKKIWDCA